MLESMFDTVGPRSRARVMARFDELFERHYPSVTAESAELLDGIGGFARMQNRAAAAQLVGIGQLFRYRLARCSETQDWAVDTEAAVAAEVGAALRISVGRASTRLRYARAMSERLPKVAAVFKAGDIDMETFAAIVYRSDLITDAAVLAAVDTQLGAVVGRWPSLTPSGLAAQIDKIVARSDTDALRRRPKPRSDRQIWIGPSHQGHAEIAGSLLGVDAAALDVRLDKLAATVCAHDPRSREQRRADALGALAAGADRLGCRCARIDCAAGTRAPASPVVIHVITETPHRRRQCGWWGGRPTGRRRAHPRRTGL